MTARKFSSCKRGTCKVFSVNFGAKWQGIMCVSRSSTPAFLGIWKGIIIGLKNTCSSDRELPSLTCQKQLLFLFFSFHLLIFCFNRRQNTSNLRSDAVASSKLLAYKEAAHPFVEISSLHNLWLNFSHHVFLGISLDKTFHMPLVTCFSLCLCLSLCLSLSLCLCLSLGLSVSVCLSLSLIQIWRSNCGRCLSLHAISWLRSLASWWFRGG